MQSVEDSFEEDPVSSSELLSVEEILKTKKKKEKPARGAAIPEGISSGFKKASELLRDAETVRLRFEAIGHQDKDVGGSPEIPAKKKRAKAAPKVEAKVKTTRAPKKRKKQQEKAIDAAAEPSVIIVDEASVPPAVTSRFFGGEAVIDDAVNEIQVSNDTAKPTREQSIERLTEVPIQGTTEDHGAVSPTKETTKPRDKQVEAPNATLNKTQHDAEETTADTNESLLTATVSTREAKPNSTVDLTSGAQDDAMIDDTSLKSFRKIVNTYSFTDETATNQSSVKAASPNALDVARPLKQNPSKEDNQKDPPLRRNKSPIKKRPLTLTERAIEEFRPADIPDSLSLLEYFPIANTSIPEGMAEAKPANMTKAKATRKVKGLETKSRLLAPTDALQTLTNQQFNFGTSSQLVVPSSSPSYKPVETSAASSVVTKSVTMPMSPPNLRRKSSSFIDLDLLLGNSSSLLGFKSTRSLWSAGTRTEEGSLLDRDIIDLCDTPAKPIVVVEKDESEDKESRSDVPQDPMPPLRPPDIPTVEPDDVLTVGQPPTQPPLQPVLPQTIPSIEKAIPTLPRSLGEAATRRRRVINSPAKRSDSQSPIKKKRKVKNSETAVVKPADAFKKVSMADLKAEVIKFGQKPQRSRIKNIEVILKCRAEQAVGNTETVAHPLDSQSAEAWDEVAAYLERQNAPTAPEPLLSPSQLDHTNALEADAYVEADAEVDPDLLPPPSFQPPAIEAQDESATTAPSEALLIEGIHKAIMAQPPTHLINSPSWKEKMAMYDPIVLEELTVWLNSGGLDAVGIDSEVWPALVRDWCESKSVCFIWQSQGWRKKRNER